MKARDAPLMTSPAPLVFHLMNSPDYFRKLARSNQMGEGCNQSRSNLGNVSFRRCTGCRSVLYFSAACQLMHWRKGHKESCKSCARGLAEARKAGPFPKFVDELEQWARSSQSLLGHMTLRILQEAAVGFLRPGAAVTPEDLTPRFFFVVVDADYIPGSRLPFKIRGKFSLCTFNVLDTPEERARVRSDGLAKEFEKAAEEEKVASSGLLVLNLIVRAEGVRKVIMRRGRQTVLIRAMREFLPLG